MTELLAVSLARAREADFGAVELIATADRLQSSDPLLAATLYRAWIAHHPDDPLLYAINFNLGVALSAQGDDEAAAEALAEAVRLNPGFLPPYINLGMVQDRLGRTADALGQWYEVVNRLGHVNAETIGHRTAALRQLGRVLEAAQFDGNAEQVLRHSLELAPQQRDVLQHWLSLRQRQCEWPVVQPVPGLDRARVVAGFSPLSLAAYTDDPLLQLAVAAEYARHDVGRPARNFAAAHAARLAASPARLHIGYLSSDLRQHAIGHLMAGIFALHDRSVVQITGLYCGHRVDDALHRRIRASCDDWIDLAGLDDEQAAQRILEAGIDIVVDINGYTHSARTRVLAMRPAPIIVNWLGFPNTTGSGYHDYIVADEVIIPPGSEIFYSETVKRLPCYQPNDRERLVAPPPESRTEARAAAGLPRDGMVFCCFNAAHKITPHAWDRWMRILHGVPDSVLWLLDGVASTKARLLEHAAAHGIDPGRVVFAAKLANPHHLARYGLADLFLDTQPYGAHTTGSDALWMGVPVLTLPGRSFASRVCASLVSAAGLPDLVCADAHEYVARAIALGREPALLAAYAQRLRDGRDHCVLFDTPLLVSRLETLFREMWDEAATLPRSGRLRRPDLANLAVYGEIGAGLDRDDVEMAALPGYRACYRQALSEHDAFAMLAPDRRLWPAD